MQLITSPSFFIGKGGGDLISFGSGQPDLPPPAETFKVLDGYCNFKYGQIAGLLSLREELSRGYAGANPEQFVITNGGSEAIDLVLRALYVPGGKILLPKPYYYSYPHNVRLAHLEADYYELVDGKIDLESLKKQLPGARAILINSPSNPTGRTQSPEVLKEIERLAHELGVYIIADNVYRDLIYEGVFYELAGPKAITIDSFSKTYSMCGFRVGYAYSQDAEIIDRIIEMKTHTSMNTNILAQEMALEALKVPRSYVAEHLAIWAERRERIYQGMKNLGLDVWKPEGAFYIFPKIANPTQAVTELYYDYDLIAYDGTWFGDPERVRFSYALDVEKIDEGLRRLERYLKARPKNI